MSADVDIRQHGAIQVLRFTRPDKKNALTGQMYALITDALEAGDANEHIAAHVILGSGGVFSAGNDISDFLRTSKNENGLGRDVLRFISRLPLTQKPLLAGVDGKAIGIGTTLLFHCDLVFATPAAEFSTPFLDLGLVPEAGSSLLMPRVMGYQLAFEMLVLGATFSAERARECGFVNHILAADKIESAVMAAASQLASKPPEALALARQLLKGDAKEISECIHREADIFRSRLASPEAREAFQAFLEKRAPRFSQAPTTNTI